MGNSRVSYKIIFTREEFIYLHKILLEQNKSRYKTFKTVKRKKGFDLNVKEKAFVKASYRRYLDAGDSNLY